MNSFAKDYISQFKPYIEDQVSYIEDNAWCDKNTSQLVGEETIQYGFAKNSLNKLEYLLSKVEREERIKYKTIQSFVELLASPALIYVNNAKKYLKFNKDWVNIEVADIKMREIAFQDSILSNILSLNKTLQKLNIDNSVGDIDIQIHSDKQIPLAMAKIMESKYPQIQEYVDEQEAKKEDGNK